MVFKLKINHSKPYFDSYDEQNILHVLHNAFVSTGPESIQFGELIARVLQKKYALPTQSGTDAITAALRVLKLKKETKIAIPAYSCTAALDALALNNCIPVVVDIDRRSLAISIEQTNDIHSLGAVIAAHLFGIPAPFYKLTHNNIIEDCAQTLSASIKDHKVGTMGRFSICSFYATKLLTTGHGGAIAVDDQDLYKNIQSLFQHDNQETWQPHLHFSLSDLNAALGISQLEKLTFFIEKRKQIAQRFANALKNNSELPNSIFSRFLIVADDNIKVLLEKFNASGIEAKRPVYKPLFHYLNQPATLFPNAQWAYEHIISIPIYPAMKDIEIDYIEVFLEEHCNEMRCWTPS